MNEGECWAIPFTLEVQIGVSAVLTFWLAYRVFEPIGPKPWKLRGLVKTARADQYSRILVIVFSLTTCRACDEAVAWLDAALPPEERSRFGVSVVEIRAEPDPAQISMKQMIRAGLSRFPTLLVADHSGRILHVLEGFFLADWAQVLKATLVSGA